MIFSSEMSKQMSPPVPKYIVIAIPTAKMTRFRTGGDKQKNREFLF